jgi:hypothetical protein
MGMPKMVMQSCAERAHEAFKSQSQRKTTYLREGTKLRNTGSREMLHSRI